MTAAHPQRRRRGALHVAARVRALPAGRHVVYRLATDLLLVFKPRGHAEAEHAHPHRQRLRVLRGALVVRIGKRTCTLKPGGRPLTLAAGRLHQTVALQDTWLSAETLADGGRSTRTGTVEGAPIHRRRHRD